MNIKSSMNIEMLRKEFCASLTEPTLSESLSQDVQILMAAYLSEIERILIDKQINRQQLAKLVNTSPGYLTQVFRGSKPLNFETIAKIQRILKIKFQLYTVELSNKTFSVKRAINNKRIPKGRLPKKQFKG